LDRTYKVAIIGSGVVGTAHGMGMLQLGHEVLFQDIKKERLEELERQSLQVTDSVDDAIRNTEICFICVPTPYSNGIDLSIIKKVTKEVAESIRKQGRWYLVVIKSTVVPMTTEKHLLPYFNDLDIGLCVNPEFLTEIASTWTDDTKFKRDFWSKERIVIGEMNKLSGDILEKIYEPIGAPIFRVSLKTAEMCKYATNMMLATKISYWNELFLVCKEIGIDCNKVAEITALDKRIGRYGTIHGKAYAGSCLPKDIKAFIHEFCTEKDGEISGYKRYPSVLHEVNNINDLMAREYGKRE
jgi:UDPglucose 6-dehydrogenase